MPFNRKMNPTGRHFSVHFQADYGRDKVLCAKQNQTTASEERLADSSEQESSVRAAIIIQLLLELPLEVCETEHWESMDKYSHNVNIDLHL